MCVSNTSDKYAKIYKYVKLILELLVLTGPNNVGPDFTLYLMHFFAVKCLFFLHISDLFFKGFIPVCSVGVCQVAKLNLGKNVSTLKYFTICGLQEGYEPFAVNMNRDVTMWISKRLPQFVSIPTNHQHIRVQSGQHPIRLDVC